MQCPACNAPASRAGPCPVCGVYVPSLGSYPKLDGHPPRRSRELALAAGGAALLAASVPIAFAGKLVCRVLLGWLCGNDAALDLPLRLAALVVAGAGLTCLAVALQPPRSDR